MLTAKVADRLARDLPEMSADELNITIGMVNDWAETASYGEGTEHVRSLRAAIREELERRKPKAVANGP